jgi:hypothetical protein
MVTVAVVVEEDGGVLGCAGYVGEGACAAGRGAMGKATARRPSELGIR